MKAILGYGRYDDDPARVGCPRAQTDMTPCAARDGNSATEVDECVGCDHNVADLFAELVRAVTQP